MRRLLTLVLVALPFVAVAPSALLPAAGPGAVRDSFAAYKQALIEGDGRAASRLTASDTHRYLLQSLERALIMNEAALRALPLVDQIAVLLLRHNMPPAELRAMRAGDPVAYAVERKAFDEAAVARLAVEPFTVTGTRAEAPLSNVKGLPLPVRVHFKEEAGAWRLDLLSSMAPLRAALDARAGLLSRLNMAEGDLAVLIVRLVSGRVPAPDIWIPPK